jgi:mRNA interferase HigB
VDDLAGPRNVRRFRLVARVQYQAGILVIRFFGTHAEYDEIDAETV